MNMTDGVLSQEGFISVRVHYNATANISGGTITSGNQSIQNYGNVEITGGTISGSLTTIVELADSVESSATTKISGGTINGTIYSWYYYEGETEPSSEDSVTVEIEGGVINADLKELHGDKFADPGTNPAESDIVVSGGKFSKSIDDGYLAEGYDMVQNTDGTYSPSVSEEEGVAKIDNIYYPTVEAALDAADNGETVEIISPDATISTEYVFSGDAILDLSGGRLVIGTEGSLSIDGGDLTVTNGTMELSGPSKLTLDKGSLTLTSCTVDCTVTGDGSTAGIIWVYGSADPEAADYSVLTVEESATITQSGDYSNGLYAICLNKVEGSNASYGVEIVMNGKIVGDDIQLSFYTNSTMNAVDGNAPHIVIGEGSTTAGGIYAAGYADWDIYGGQFTGTTAVSIKSGTFDIHGGTFHASGENTAPPTPNNNGSEETGAAISITTNSGYAQKTVVNIYGGTFKSDHGYALYEGIANDSSGSAADRSAAVILIEGGSFEGGIDADVRMDAAQGKKVIRGGSFSTDVSAYLEDGYVLEDNGDGTMSAIPSEEQKVTVVFDIEPSDTIVQISQNGIEIITVTGNDTVELRPGLYEIRCSADGFETETFTMTVDSGAESMTFSESLERSQTIPPTVDDDDYVPLPPQIVYDDSDDDDTVKIVACAAAAVVAAIIAAFLIILYRKD